jgi:hypothetical protein
MSERCPMVLTSVDESDMLSFGLCLSDYPEGRAFVECDGQWIIEKRWTMWKREYLYRMRQLKSDIKE